MTQPTPDLVERLRAFPEFWTTDGVRWYRSSDKDPLCAEAAAEITRLRALTWCGCGDEFTEHDPGTCGNCVASRDQSAELERLRAEVEALRADAERNRWLLREDPGAVAATAWRVKAACAFAEPEAALDAAMKEPTP